MIASIEKVQAGIIKYADSEFLNHLEGWQKIGAGASIALIVKNLPNTLAIYSKKPFIAMLGVMDNDLNIDIDVLHDAVMDYFKTDGEYVTIPMIGRIKFTRNDVEMLYNYIKEA